MDTYSLLREIADSWVLLAMFVFFIGVWVWAFWPSQAPARRDAQMIPFRDADFATTQPAAPTLKLVETPCKNDCRDCGCIQDSINRKGRSNG